MHIQSLSPNYCARHTTSKKWKLCFSKVILINKYALYIILYLALLKIKPAPNNGTMGSLNSLLVPEARVNVSESHGDGTVFRKDICKFPNDKVFNISSRNGVCDSCNVSLLIFLAKSRLNHQWNYELICYNIVLAFCLSSPPLEPRLLILTKNLNSILYIACAH